MKHGTLSVIARILVITLTLLSFQTARAGMIATPQATDAQRSTVISVIDRADVSRQLQAMGLDPQVAKDRVAALSDQELSALSGKLETLPAGGMSNWWIGVIVVAIIGAIVWANYGYKMR
ncbi:MAG TPA: PA2779 family protein [Burkholderiales bacterium]|nr:PA2779 family protein [Burkholderiales bacterium]